jgi:hypothetical protein
VDAGNLVRTGDPNGVRLRVRTVEDATTIPGAAVQRASFGTFVTSL